MSKAFALQIYSWLVSFYPKTYRDHFGDDMKTTFEDLVDEAHQKGGIISVMFLIGASSLDTALQILKEHYLFLTQRDEYMAHAHVINPVRGFKALFTIAVFLTIILSVLGGPILDYLMYAYFIAVGILLVRSQRGWPLALAVVMLGGMAAFILSMLMVSFVHGVWFELLLQKISNGNENLIGRMSLAIYSLLNAGAYLLVGYFLVKEIEKPKLPAIWDMLSEKTTPEKQEKAWHIVRIIVLIAAIVSSFVFAVNSWPIFLLIHESSASLGEITNNLTGVFSYLYAFAIGGIIIFVGFITLLIVTASTWVISGRRFLPTALVAVVIGLSFIGCNIAANYYMLPSMPQAGGGSGMAISDQEGQDLVRSCAVKTAQEQGITVEQAWIQFGYQGIEAPGTHDTAALCVQLTTPHQEGTMVYDGGYGSSGDPETGKPSGFWLSAEKLPQIQVISQNPLFFLAAAWFTAFILPGLIVLVSVAIVRKRYQMK